MDDREFKLRVLEVILPHATMAQVRNPTELAQQCVDWCLQPLDKPQGPKEKAPARTTRRDKQKPPQFLITE